MWNRIEEKVLRGERLTTDEGVHLLTEAPLVELGALANEVRARRTDPRIVTYVIDTNPNYTNWCTVDCHFCAFYRKVGKPAADAYTHDVDGVMAMTRLLAIPLVALAIPAFQASSRTLPGPLRAFSDWLPLTNAPGRATRRC